jgi:hypothetical protein
MMRQWLAAAFVATLPWTGCDREPVAPPATPPAERAPVESAAPAGQPVPHDTLLIDLRRGLG